MQGSSDEVRAETSAFAANSAGGATDCRPLGWHERPVALGFGLPGLKPLFKVRLMALADDAPAIWNGCLPQRRPSFAALHDRIKVIALSTVPDDWAQPRIKRFPDAIHYVVRRYEVNAIRIEGAFEQYLTKFNAKSRNTLRRKARKFAEAAGTTEVLREYRRAEQMADFHRAACAVAQKSYQWRVTAGATINPSPTFVSALQELACRDSARGYVLWFGRTPAAYMHCRSIGSALVLIHTGFDPAFTGLSPGTVLLFESLRRIFEDRFDHFDFGPGDWNYKAYFSNVRFPCGDVYLLRRRAGLELLARIHSGFSVFHEVCLSVLNRLGVRDRVRRFVQLYIT